MDQPPGEGKEESLAARLAARQHALERFSKWEEAQARQTAPAVDPDAVQQALEWYADALELAERTGGTGRGASEWHLVDLIAWMRRWRKAWGAT